MGSSGGRWCGALRAVAAATWVLAGCAGGPAAAARRPVVHHVQLDDAAAFAALSAAFAAANPGYRLTHHAHCLRLDAVDADRVVFVQGPGDRRAEPSAGDVLLVRRGATWRSPDGTAFDLLAFCVPGALPADLPAVVRPDWDPRITDVPGGCATEGDAYRRILLTWRPEVGPYVLHELNAHRVRITDSFTHYHPAAGGFDEFYLVQEVPRAGGAELLVAPDAAAIEAHAVTAAQAKDLLQRRPLHAGDLVYLPRGTVHRGRGGAVVQVISVPGFVPGTEIGVDHHLWAINRELGLTGEGALPFHVVAARTAVVR